MAAVIKSFSIDGINAVPVEIQTIISKGAPHLIIIGLENQSVFEAGERVHAAMEHLGYFFPASRITASLAPGDLLAIKIAAMIKELEDPDNEYTFDEIGEYLVWKAIIAAMEIDDADTDESGCSHGWCTSATTDEIKEAYKEAVRICGDMADEFAYEEIITDDDSPSSQMEDCYYKLMSEQTDDFVGRAIYAPRLIRKYTEEVYISFVIWDLDFAFIEAWGINDWITFARENSDKLGFVESAPGRDPISGSLKSPIKKTGK